MGDGRFVTVRVQVVLHGRPVTLIVKTWDALSDTREGQEQRIEERIQQHLGELVTTEIAVTVVDHPSNDGRSMLYQL